MKSYQVGVQSLQAQYEANVLPHAQYASPSIFEGLDDKAVAYLNQTMDNIRPAPMPARLTTTSNMQTS